MRTRGRQSAASLAIVAPVFSSRPQPWPGLPQEAGRLWNSIVQSLPAGYFRESDYPMLADYCRIVGRVDLCSQKLDEQGLVIDSDRGPKESPYVKIHDTANRQMSSLAVKLRLCPSSRVRAESASLQAVKTGPKPWEHKEANQ